MSIAVGPQERDRPRGIGRGVPLVEADEGLVVDGLERRHHEDAARGGELGPQVGVPQHVLDLDRAVEREVGKRSCIARTTRMACGGALRKSGSPKVMWVAPAATSWSTSASTAAASVMRMRPS